MPVDRTEKIRTGNERHVRSRVKWRSRDGAPTLGLRIEKDLSQRQTRKRIRRFKLPSLVRGRQTAKPDFSQKRRTIVGGPETGGKVTPDRGSVKGRKKIEGWGR